MSTNKHNVGLMILDVALEIFFSSVKKLVEPIYSLYYKMQHCIFLSIMLKEFLSLEDEELQEDLLARMNASVTSLYFPPFTPLQHEMYKVG